MILRLRHALNKQGVIPVTRYDHGAVDLRRPNLAVCLTVRKWARIRTDLASSMLALLLVLFLYYTRTGKGNNPAAGAGGKARSAV